MDTLSYKTVSLNAATVKKEWFVIDATDLALGRLASRVALVLRGKNKPGYTPHVDCGDNVIVINAEKVMLKGDKMDNRVYVRSPGYPGDKIIGNLHVYAGPEHPHQAQNPREIKLNEI
mgnify:CR=1 FL=1